MRGREGLHQIQREHDRVVVQRVVPGQERVRHWVVVGIRVADRAQARRVGRDLSAVIDLIGVRQAHHLGKPEVAPLAAQVPQLDAHRGQAGVGAHDGLVEGLWVHCVGKLLVVGEEEDLQRVDDAPGLRGVGAQGEDVRQRLDVVEGEACLLGRDGGSLCDHVGVSFRRSDAAAGMQLSG